ncbi:ATPase, F1/V1/A1 complex, alpha/beta subunit [Tanacetum coccineum]
MDKGVFGNGDKANSEEVENSEGDKLDNNDKPNGGKVANEEIAKEIDFEESNKHELDNSLCFRPTLIEEDGVDNNGGCFFKFKNEEDMEKVIEQGPWIVNHKPLFVQKWDPTIGLEKTEETKIPLWAKLKNIPLEAWTKDGISALASSLGTPLRMDNVTAQACQVGRGRAEFARFLVEFDVKKGFKDEIMIQYKSKENVVKGVKKVVVEYLWEPDICSNCLVFGHSEKTQ